MRLRRVIPNLPDVVLRRIFDFLTYEQLCKAECVCRRWQSIVLSIMRRTIHEITVERFGVSSPSVHQVVAFRRLSISCPGNAYDFLAGVIRRSRLSLVRMTTDIEFLANLQHVHVNKEERRKYFSNVEELWLLIIDCSDDITERFLAMESVLFTEILFLTIQVHLRAPFYSNVAKVINAFVQRYPKATTRLEIHAENSSMIINQLLELPPVSLRRIKLICTEFNLPRFRFSHLYRVMKDRNIKAKSIAVRDWTLLFDPSTPITAHPIDVLRISSCAVEAVDDFVATLQLTAKQPIPKRKRIVRPDGAAPKLKKPDVIDGLPVKVKRTTKRKLSFIKKLELAGQCTFRQLQFLQNKAHEELEKRLAVAIPEMVVNSDDIYYCW